MTAPESSRRKVWLRLIAALVITAAMTAVIAAKVDIGAIGGHLTAARPGWLVAAALLVPVISLLRGIRLAIVVRRPPTPPLLAISVLHNFVASVAPMRSGELALPLLLRRLGIDAWHSAGLLLALRGYDLLAVLFFGGLATVWLGPDIPALRPLAPAALVLAIGATLTALLLPRVVAALHRLVASFAERPWMARLDRPLCGILSGFDRRRGLWVLYLVSLLTFAVNFTFFHWCAIALGADQQPMVTMFCGCAAVLAFVLPINGLASFGPIQGAWTATAALAGVPADLAFATSVLMHALFLAVSGGLALISLMFLPRPDLYNKSSTGAI
ncbi:lysylphosphatidylglycerol synthase transmembrane domain-containing protein [Magnetospirillum moscoviense]|uniref:Lysylphosphatidylglycerol synthetase n=1 Tax=Magnetospirillum moscoviense TaxID=1437059 RepID=A0A178MWT6_9PROT|nr:lysylphosphatidylglycerol synthase domain-containing protein [Magnetospirillum moscoviense]OAN54993.1 hypothetical protein A6A05_00080 [Magnetospirillum moscoviense]